MPNKEDETPENVSNEGNESEEKVTEEKLSASIEPAEASKTEPVAPGAEQAGVPGQEGKPKKSKSGLLLSFIGLFLFLFVLFMVFLVVMLLQDGGNNPILRALGVEPALLKQLLTTLISLVFGFLSFVSFIVFLVGVFRRFTSTKAEVDKKKQSLILAVASGLFFAFCVFLWIVLYFYISRLQLGGQGAAVILTDPEDTINLSAPIDITFTAREIEKLYFREGIVSYAWDLDADGDFDDGNGRDIQYSYTTRGNADGVYDVALKIILGNAQEVLTNRLVTIANVRPSVVIDYQPKILEIPIELSFDASKSIDPDGNIISFDWDFDDDGEIDAQGEKAKWSFSKEEVQEIVLKVTDNNGEVVEERLLLDFKKGKTKEAVMIIRPGVKGKVPFSVSFDASNSYIGERVLGYEWDFGDDSPLAKGRQATHQYTEPGEYKVILVVMGTEEGRFVAEETIIVERSTSIPTAVIEVKEHSVINNVLRGEAPFSVEFDASESTDPDGSIVDYRWDFDGDGTFDDVGEKATYTFIEDKTYEVILTVIDDDDLSSTAELQVKVEVPDVVASLEVSTYSGSIPLEVTFDASSSRAETGKIISYTWDFGDQTAEVIGSARQTHVFNKVGEYTVTVMVLTNENKRGTNEVLIVAREIELQADFIFNPQEPKVGQKVFFNAENSQGQISRYYWEFGDGAISRVIKPDHIYENVGTYTVKLEIYDRKDRISRKEVVVLVTNP